MVIETHGTDTNGKAYESVDEMWKAEIGSEDARKDWYTKGVHYWDSVPATVDGVLGGYGRVSRQDGIESEQFLKAVMPVVKEKDAKGLVACDCGAGVGRVTKETLINFFNEVDLVEPVRHFIDEAEQSLGVEGAVEGFVTKDGKRPARRADGHRADRFVCEGLETFAPEAGRYDAIWCQWVLGHLPDDDLVELLKRFAVGLKPWGMVIIKENNCQDVSGFIVDKEDHAITRTDKYFREIFKRAGMKLVHVRKQRNFPDELFQVRMYALVPEDSTSLLAEAVDELEAAEKKSKGKAAGGGDAAPAPAAPAGKGKGKGKPAGGGS